MSGQHFLRIGGITIALRGTGAPATWDWAPATSRFLVSEAPADIEAVVRVGAPDSSPGNLLFDSGAVWRLFRDGAGYRIETRAPMFGGDPYRVALFDETFSRGEIFLSPAAAERGVNPLEYPLDEILVSNLLARGRGVELHSCGLVDREGGGRLFVGVSGAGKTTTARLWDGSAAEILSDDRIIVREDEGGLWMYGTPWHGEAELSVAARAPLTAVYLLVQAEANAIRPLSDAAAIARLFLCTFPPFHDPEALAFTTAFLERIVTRVPVRELQFTRDGGAVEVVRGDDER